MATRTELSNRPSTKSVVAGQMPTPAGAKETRRAAYLAVALAIALGLAIAWQATLAGQLLSGNGSALRLHQYGAYATFLLVLAAVIVEVVSGWRSHRWGRAAVAGLLAVAISVQFELGYFSAAHASGLAYHVPLGVSIAGLYVFYLTLRLRRQ